MWCIDNYIHYDEHYVNYNKIEFSVDNNSKNANKYKTANKSKNADKSYYQSKSKPCYQLKYNCYYKPKCK